MIFSRWASEALNGARVGVDGDEPVADAPHVLDPMPVAGAAQLLAQLAGVAVDRACARRAAKAPDVA